MKARKLVSIWLMARQRATVTKDLLQPATAVKVK